MSRVVVATPLFAARLKGFLDEYAALGAVPFVERVQNGYRSMIENLSESEKIAPARRRSIGGKTTAVREHVIDAVAREFLVLYWVPPDSQPMLHPNARIGAQHRFRWKQ